MPLLVLSICLTCRFRITVSALLSLVDPAHQLLFSQFFAGRIPFLPPSQQRQSTEGKPQRVPNRSKSVAQRRAPKRS